MAAVAKPRRRIRRGLKQTDVPVREMIGRTAPRGRHLLPASRYVTSTVDTTRSDYAFYDRLRRGQAAGYRLGALFAARIERIFSDWVLGRGLEVILRADNDLSDTRVDATNVALKKFVNGLLDTGAGDNTGDPDRDMQSGAFLLNILRDTIGLGDQWIIVNTDGSLSVPSPDTVTQERDPLDYRRLLKLTVTTKLEDATVIDEYRADGRTLTVKRAAMVESVEEFVNPIGRIPVVHVAYGMGANEIYGHSIHEALLRLYDLYDDVLHKQIDGAKLFGSPIPVVTGLKDFRQAINVNAPASTESYVDAEGNEVARQQLTLDENAMWLLGEGGDAKFLAPPVGFTGDTKDTLKLLFLLLLDHTGVPEFIWGNEVSSGRSSSETQLEWFVRSIEGMQRDNGGWILRLCTIWLEMQALTDPRLVVGPLQVVWPAIRDVDQELMLKRLGLASDRGLLSDKTLLALLDLVDNPAVEVNEAAAQADARRQAMFPFGDSAAFQARLMSRVDSDDEQEDA